MAKPKTVKAIADTTEEAFTKSTGDIPANAHILREDRSLKTWSKVVIVEAFDEESARAQAANQVGKNCNSKYYSADNRGKTRILGVGKKTKII